MTAIFALQTPLSDFLEQFQKENSQKFACLEGMRCAAVAGIILIGGKGLTR